MGKLHHIRSVILRIWASDHLPPHFHAIGPDYEALVEIDSLLIIKGRLPNVMRRDVLMWAAANRALIAEEWNRINPRFPI